MLLLLHSALARGSRIVWAWSRRDHVRSFLVELLLPTTPVSLDTTSMTREACRPKPDHTRVAQCPLALSSRLVPALRTIHSRN
jgi:hypothetical protein